MPSGANGSSSTGVRRGRTVAVKSGGVADAPGRASGSRRRVAFAPGSVGDCATAATLGFRGAAVLFALFFASRLLLESKPVVPAPEAGGVPRRCGLKRPVVSAPRLTSVRKPGGALGSPSQAGR